MCVSPSEYDLSRSVEEWIALLDAPLLEDAEDATWALVNLARGGFEVIDPVVAALPGLTEGGQVEALEGFLEIGSERPAGAIIELLETSQDEFVRQRCAEYLGELRITAAVPALRRAYRATRDRRVEPDVVEPAALRQALTDIGALTPVLPATSAARAVSTESASKLLLFRLVDANSVLDDLAAAEQVVLGVQAWQQESDGTLRGGGSPGYGDPGFRVDEAPWPEVVRRARDYAAAYVLSVLDTWPGTPTPPVLVSIDWIDRSDL